MSSESAYAVVGVICTVGVEGARFWSVTEEVSVAVSPEESCTTTEHETVSVREAMEESSVMD